MLKVAVLPVAALAVIASGCGGSSANVAAGSATAGVVSFAGCMRTHGVTHFPDPGGNGATAKVSLAQLGVGASRFQAAEHACRHLLPGGGRPPNETQRQQIKAEGLRFARCVRAHGVPGFPDPGSDGRIPDPAAVGVDQGSPKFQAANDACAKSRPPYMPSNSAYNAWARTHAG